MEQDPEVVPTSQGSPNTPYYRGTGTHLKSEGRSLHVAPSVGRGNPDTSKNSKDFGQTPVWGVYYIGSVETMNVTVSNNIRDEGRTLEGISKGVDQVKRPRLRTFGQTGRYDEVGIQRRTYPGGTGMDNNVAHP